MKKAVIYTPVVTAFDMNGNIDVQGNKAVYDFLIEGGVDGIVLMGSTGEFFSMTDSQKRQLIDIAAEYCKGRTKLLVGTSCMRADETIDLANYALSKGAEAVMVIGPYYFSLADENIEAYYDEIAEKINGPIYIYNFPERNGYDVKPEIVLRLARKHSNIVGYKDTTSEMPHTRSLIQTMKSEFPDFTILSGTDEFLAHVVASGGNGCIGALANIMPEVMAKYVRAINDKDFDSISKYQQIVDEASELYGICSPFIPAFKEAMIQRDVNITNVCNSPFKVPNEDEKKKIRFILKKVHLI